MDFLKSKSKELLTYLLNIIFGILMEDKKEANKKFLSYWLLKDKMFIRLILYFLDLRDYRDPNWDSGVP